MAPNASLPVAIKDHFVNGIPDNWQYVCKYWKSLIQENISELSTINPIRVRKTNTTKTYSRNFPEQTSTPQTSSENICDFSHLSRLHSLSNRNVISKRNFKQFSTLELRRIANTCIAIINQQAQNQSNDDSSSCLTSQQNGTESASTKTKSKIANNVHFEGNNIQLENHPKQSIHIPENVAENRQKTPERQFRLQCISNLPLEKPQHLSAATSRKPQRNVANCLKTHVSITSKSATASYNSNKQSFKNLKINQDLLSIFKRQTNASNLVKNQSLTSEQTSTPFKKTENRTEVNTKSNVTAHKQNAISSECDDNEIFNKASNTTINRSKNSESFKDLFHKMTKKFDFPSNDKSCKITSFHVSDLSLNFSNNTNTSKMKQTSPNKDLISNNSLVNRNKMSKFDNKTTSNIHETADISTNSKIKSTTKQNISNMSNNLKTKATVKNDSYNIQTNAIIHDTNICSSSKSKITTNAAVKDKNSKTKSNRILDISKQLNVQDNYLESKRSHINMESNSECLDKTNLKTTAIQTNINSDINNKKVTKSPIKTSRLIQSDSDSDDYLITYSNKKKCAKMLPPSAHISKSNCDDQITSASQMYVDNQQKTNKSKTKSNIVPDISHDSKRFNAQNTDYSDINKSEEQKLVYTSLKTSVKINKVTKSPMKTSQLIQSDSDHDDFLFINNAKRKIVNKSNDQINAIGKKLDSKSQSLQSELNGTDPAAVTQRSANKSKTTKNRNNLDKKDKHILYEKAQIEDKRRSGIINEEPKGDISKLNSTDLNLTASRSGRIRCQALPFWMGARFINETSSNISNISQELNLTKKNNKPKTTGLKNIVNNSVHSERENIDTSKKLITDSKNEHLLAVINKIKMNNSGTVNPKISPKCRDFPTAEKQIKTKSLKQTVCSTKAKRNSKTDESKRSSPVREITSQKLTLEQDDIPLSMYINNFSNKSSDKPIASTKILNKSAKNSNKSKKMSQLDIVSANENNLSENSNNANLEKQIVSKKSRNPSKLNKNKEDRESGLLNNESNIKFVSPVKTTVKFTAESTNKETNISLICDSKIGKCTLRPDEPEDIINIKVVSPQNKSNARIENVRISNVVNSGINLIRSNNFEQSIATQNDSNFIKPCTSKLKSNKSNVQNKYTESTRPIGSINYTTIANKEKDTTKSSINTKNSLTNNTLTKFPVVSLPRMNLDHLKEVLKNKSGTNAIKQNSKINVTAAKSPVNNRKTSTYKVIENQSNVSSTKTVPKQTIPRNKRKLVDMESSEQEKPKSGKKQTIQKNIRQTLNLINASDATSDTSYLNLNTTISRRGRSRVPKLPFWAGVRLNTLKNETIIEMPTTNNQSMYNSFNSTNIQKTKRNKNAIESIESLNTIPISSVLEHKRNSRTLRPSTSRKSGNISDVSSTLVNDVHSGQKSSGIKDKKRNYVKKDISRCEKIVKKPRNSKINRISLPDTAQNLIQSIKYKNTARDSFLSTVSQSSQSSNTARRRKLFSQCSNDIDVLLSPNAEKDQQNFVIKIANSPSEAHDWAEVASEVGAYNIKKEILF